MKHWKKGLLAAVLLAALALGMASPAFGSGSAAGVNLMAVNDRMVETTAENMPRTVGGVLYVPYTMLSQRSTGIDLGVSALYSTTRRTVLVTDRGRKGIAFDLQANSAEDLDGNPVPARAMVRNTTVFIPIDYLCQYFGTISCSRTATRHGTLIRVTSSAAVLSDQAFVDAADNLLASNLKRYLESVEEARDDPAPSEEVQPSDDPPSGAELYLALRCGEEGEECARLVEDRDMRALFLFTPEQLEEHDCLVRRLVGAGHTVGLVLPGETAEDCLVQGSEGAALLAAIARYPALVVSAPNLDAPGREALAGAGYVLWDAGVRGEDYRSGSALVRGLSARQVSWVELGCGPGGADFLRAALGAMAEEECQVYLPTAPVLAQP